MKKTIVGILATALLLSPVCAGAFGGTEGAGDGLLKARPLLADAAGRSARVCDDDGFHGAPSSPAWRCEASAA